jgi:hypothetical protein
LLVPEFCRETVNGLNVQLRAGGFMMKLMKFKLKQDLRIRKYKEFLSAVFSQQRELFDK